MEKEGRRNAEHDHELIERNQAPAHCAGANFRDVNRRDENGSADRHAAENPGDDKNRKMSRECGEQGRSDKKHRRGDQDFLSPEAVTKETRYRCATQNSPAKTTHRQAKQKITPIPA